MCGVLLNSSFEPFFFTRTRSSIVFLPPSVRTVTPQLLNCGYSLTRMFLGSRSVSLIFAIATHGSSPFTAACVSRLGRFANLAQGDIGPMLAARELAAGHTPIRGLARGVEVRTPADEGRDPAPRRRIAVPCPAGAGVEAEQLSVVCT